MKISEESFISQVRDWGLILDPREQGVEETLLIDLEVVGKKTAFEYLVKSIQENEKCMIWTKSWYGCSSEEVEIVKNILDLDVEEILVENCWFEISISDDNFSRLLSIFLNSINGWTVYIYLKTKIFLIWESEIIDEWVLMTGMKPIQPKNNFGFIPHNVS